MHLLGNVFAKLLIEIISVLTCKNKCISRW